MKRYTSCATKWLAILAIISVAVLIAGIICIVMLVGLNKVGTGYKDIYNRINNSIIRAETVKPETEQ